MSDFPQLKGFKASPGLVRLIGHRGARGLMPENTIEGFEFTLDMGVTALEFVANGTVAAACYKQRYATVI